MPDFYTFPECGCKFEIIGPAPEGSDIPLLKIDNEFFLEKIRLDCPTTWALICDGKTRGIFQQETQLGQAWCKKIKPTSIEHLAAIGAALRPGCLKSITDGKSMTLHYSDRKNGIEPVSYIHPSLEPILKDTYGCILFQEQSLAIARTIAGFSLGESMLLQNAISKKKPEEMAVMKVKFLEGAKKVGIANDDLAIEIFNIIEKSQRYSFVRAHATAYAIDGYWTAYCKNHFPVQFFTSYLKYALDKGDAFDEIKELVSDAKYFGIQIKPPDIRTKRQHFHNFGRSIYFGLLDVKGLGLKKLATELDNLEKTERTAGKPIGEWTYIELLFFLLDSNKSFVEPIILGGAIDFIKIPRKKILYDYHTLAAKTALTSLEIEWLKLTYPIKKWEFIEDALIDAARPKKDGGACANKNRVARLLDLVKILQNPTSVLEDDAVWVSWMESKYLGIPITASIIDMDTGTCCDDVLRSECPTFFQIAVEIQNVKFHKTKKGDQMAFLTVSDHSGIADNFVVFPQQLSDFSSMIVKENSVLLNCKYEKEKGSVIVQHVKQI